jgi:hypothetical protein
MSVGVTTDTSMLSRFFRRVGIAQFLHDGVTRLIERVSDDDPRPWHFALVVLHRKGVADDNTEVVTTNLITSMRREYLHEYLRDWLHRETQ